MKKNQYFSSIFLECNEYENGLKNWKMGLK